MIFTNLDTKKRYLEDECEKLRLNIIELVKIRDTTLNEINDQRRGKQEVFMQAISIGNEVFALETHLNATLQALNDSRVSFYGITDKQRAKIEELNNSIANRLSELSIQEGKEIIDIDALNIEFKKEISKTKKELQGMKDEIEHIKEERKEFELYKEEIVAKLTQEKELYIGYMDSLEIKEKALDLKENRLAKLYLELTK